jgi:hypothetical protein
MFMKLIKLTTSQHSPVRYRILPEFCLLGSCLRAVSSTNFRSLKLGVHRYEWSSLYKVARWIDSSRGKMKNSNLESCLREEVTTGKILVRKCFT